MVPFSQRTSWRSEVDILDIRWHELAKKVISPFPRQNIYREAVRNVIPRPIRGARSVEHRTTNLLWSKDG